MFNNYIYIKDFLRPVLPPPVLNPVVLRKKFLPLGLNLKLSVVLS